MRIIEYCPDTSFCRSSRGKGLTGSDLPHPVVTRQKVTNKLTILFLIGEPRCFCSAATEFTRSEWAGSSGRCRGRRECGAGLALSARKPFYGILRSGENRNTIALPVCSLASAVSFLAVWSQMFGANREMFDPLPQMFGGSGSMTVGFPSRQTRRIALNASFGPAPQRPLFLKPQVSAGLRVEPRSSLGLIE